MDYCLPFRSVRLFPINFGDMVDSCVATDLLLRFINFVDSSAFGFSAQVFLLLTDRIIGTFGLSI